LKQNAQLSIFGNHKKVAKLKPYTCKIYFQPSLFSKETSTDKLEG